jgi:hypothetical protein
MHIISDCMHRIFKMLKGERIPKQARPRKRRGVIDHDRTAALEASRKECEELHKKFRLTPAMQTQCDERFAKLQGPSGFARIGMKPFARTGNNSYYQ